MMLLSPRLLNLLYLKNVLHLLISLDMSYRYMEHPQVVAAAANTTSNTTMPGKTTEAPTLKKLQSKKLQHLLTLHFQMSQCLDPA